MNGDFRLDVEFLYEILFDILGLEGEESENKKEEKSFHQLFDHYKSVYI